MDETGESSRISFPITDDGSISSKQRLELLIRMYNQHLEDYRSSLEEEYSNEKDTAKKSMLIEQDFAIYKTMLWNEFFPQIVALEKQIAVEEEKAKISAKREKKLEKRKLEEEKKLEQERKLEEEEQERQEQERVEQERLETSKQEEQESKDSENPKPKTKSQELIEEFGGELKSQGINFDEFKEKENLDLENLNPNEENRLSMLVFEGLKYSIDKSDTNHNPGWLLLYLNTIHEALAKLLSPHTLLNCSNMIMSYLHPRYNLDYNHDAPQLFEDLKHSEKFKHLPIHKKILLYELKVAKDMSNGYISKDNSSHNILLYLLDAVPFSAIENKPERFEKQAEDKNIPVPFHIDYTISEEYNNSMHFLDPTYKKEEKAKKPSNLYYVYDENIPLVEYKQENNFNGFVEPVKPSIGPFTAKTETKKQTVNNPTYIIPILEKQIIRFEHFVLHVKENKDLIGMKFEDKINSFKKSQYEDDSSSGITKTINEVPQKVAPIRLISELNDKQ